jgi:CBS domain-containing protein
MTVKAILAQKGRDVVTIEPTADLVAVIRTLADRRIGALLVTDLDKGVIGILSERDIVRALAEHGASVLGRTVEEVMTRKVVTCSEADTVGEIMERMTTGKFRHLPVIEGGELVGIVSIGDVVKYRLAEVQRESEALRDYIASA